MGKSFEALISKVNLKENSFYDENESIWIWRLPNSKKSFYYDNGEALTFRIKHCDF
jgi:hypothetical protein